MLKEFTRNEIIEAGSVSENVAVRKAYDKLKFALELAHSKGELEDLSVPKLYQLRISRKTTDNSTYEHILIRWCNDEFVVYAPAERGGTISGTAKPFGEDPAIVYLKGS